VTRDGDPAGGTVPWSAFAREAERRLAAAGVPSPAAEARWLVEQASGHEGAAYAVGLEEPATARGVAYLDRMLDRRLAGEPLQYVLGRWAFRTLDLYVDRRVLIPRPETEVVVGCALEELDRIRAERDPGQRAPDAVVVDLGTGSGAIALSVAVERERVEVWATERSAGAVDVARANLAGIGRAAARVRVVEGSWFEPLPAELAGRVDVVVSNPPYVAAGEALPEEVARWEPAAALVAGPRGTEALEVVLEQALRWLGPWGSVVVELAPHQAEAMAGHARALGYREVRVEPDLAGRSRVLVARPGGDRLR
jgi:release factor glutamine methyltransferase